MYAALGAKPNIEYVDMPPAIRNQYQYFTQAEVANLQRAGYNAGFAPLEEFGAPLRHAVPRSGRPVPLMLDFEKRLASIAQQTILCVGDLMLDDFVYGEVERISPEAPAPVLAVKRNEVTIGGAGNVARNIASLGARCIFVGMVGEDAAGRDVIARLQAEQLIEPSLVVDTARPTTRKMRFVSEHFSTHLLRADWEQAGPVSAALEGELIARALAAIPRVGAVVLSDYAKGVLTPRVVARSDRCGKARARAGDRRSEGAGLCGLSRRDRDHAEPARA